MVFSSYQDMDLSVQLLQNLMEMGHRKPLPVQQHVIPLVAKGIDVMAVSPTGSGKTAAFMLPIINSLIRKHSVDPGDRVAGRPRFVYFFSLEE